MRAVVQRVAGASVEADGEAISEIGPGLLIYLGVGKEDAEADLDWMVNKTASLRIFADAEGKMNLSAEELNYEALVVSQFTLFGDARKGARPNFTSSAPPEPANALYEKFIEKLNVRMPARGGRFQAHMKVESVNDGPVTILLDSKKLF